MIRDLEAVIAPQNVIRRKEELLVHECDGLTSHKQRPALVVLPRTTEEVVAAVRVCDRHKKLPTS